MTGKRSTEANIQSFRVGMKVATKNRIGLVACLVPDSLGGLYILFEVGTLKHFTAQDKELRLIA